jgi:hypothetical protein
MKHQTTCFISTLLLRISLLLLFPVSFVIPIFGGLLLLLLLLLCSGSSNCSIILLGITYYLKTDSVCVKFVDNNLKVSHRRHVYNFLLVNNISYKIRRYGYGLLVRTESHHHVVLQPTRELPEQNLHIFRIPISTYSFNALIKMLPVSQFCASVMLSLLTVGN